VDSPWTRRGAESSPHLAAPRRPPLSLFSVSSSVPHAFVKYALSRWHPFKTAAPYVASGRLQNEQALRPSDTLPHGVSRGDLAVLARLPSSPLPIVWILGLSSGVEVHAWVQSLCVAPSPPPYPAAHTSAVDQRPLVCVHTAILSSPRRSSVFLRSVRLPARIPVRACQGRKRPLVPVPTRRVSGSGSHGGRKWGCAWAIGLGWGGRGRWLGRMGFGEGSRRSLYRFVAGRLHLDVRSAISSL